MLFTVFSSVMFSSLLQCILFSSNLISVFISSHLVFIGFIKPFKGVRDGFGDSLCRTVVFVGQCKVLFVWILYMSFFPLGHDAHVDFSDTPPP